ncbi:MAG TPA: hypothetical protein VNO52_07175 [Methylomirabilota bacterium]|nr:hypothetical protein [Methylomirabilota bacterium]
MKTSHWCLLFVGAALAAVVVWRESSRTRPLSPPPSSEREAELLAEVDQLRAEAERFWRKDPARSSGEHSGLGLAVSEAFARHLGCVLSASMPAPNQLVLTLSGLPAAPG